MQVKSANTVPANNIIGQLYHTVTSPEKFKCQKILWLESFIFKFFMNQLYIKGIPNAILVGFRPLVTYWLQYSKYWLR